MSVYSLQLLWMIVHVCQKLKRKGFMQLGLPMKEKLVQKVFQLLVLVLFIQFLNKSLYAIHLKFLIIGHVVTVWTLVGIIQLPYLVLMIEIMMFYIFMVNIKMDI